MVGMFLLERSWLPNSHLVHDECGALLEVSDALVREVQHATRSADQDVHHVVQTHDIVLKGGTPCCDLVLVFSCVECCR